MKKLLLLIACIFYLSINGFSQMDSLNAKPDTGAYIKMDIEPGFLLRSDVWKNYLRQQIDSIGILGKYCPTGNYYVVVQYEVAADGTLSNVRGLTNVGYGMEDEVVKAINNGAGIVEQERTTQTRTVAAQVVDFHVSKTPFDQPVKISSANLIKVNDTGAFVKVEIEAGFKGGTYAWGHFLQTNLDANVPNTNNAPSGIYVTMVKFVVDVDGTVQDIHPITACGYGMEKEVVRVLKNGPKWNPAMLNGKPVKAYRVQPVTFEVNSN
jgi:hypothetical protein